MLTAQEQEAVDKFKEECLESAAERIKRNLHSRTSIAGSREAEAKALRTLELKRFIEVLVEQATNPRPRPPRPTRYRKESTYFWSPRAMIGEGCGR